jgi:cbb3-type cytochrome oxidase maturation protein
MFILILASLLVAIGFLLAFLWAVKSGQYEDKHTPKIRMLLEDKINGSEIDLNHRKSKEN